MTNEFWSHRRFIPLAKRLVMLERFRCAARGLCLGVAAMHLAGCSPVMVLNATVPSWGYRKTKGVVYGDEPRQKLDVYTPGRRKAGAPVVVYFYGGGWQQGGKAEAQFVAEALTSRGYVTVVPDYRLYPNVTFPAFIEDGAQAVRWARDNASKYNADPSRIYLMGHSAGAHLAALLVLDEKYLNDVGVDRTIIRGMAGMGGPYDFKATGQYGRVFAQVDPSPTTGSARHSYNAMDFVDGDEPPMLLMQGTADKLVEPANASRLARRIREKGGEATCLMYRGVGHSRNLLALAWTFRWVASTLDDTTAFFEAHR